MFGKFRHRRETATRITAKALRRALIFIALIVILVLPLTVANADTLAQVIGATWPAEAQSEAIGIAYEESGGNPVAQNPSGAYCLFQIMPETAAGLGVDYSSLADPYYCSRAAAKLYSMYGWAPWTAYPASGAAMGMGSIEVGGASASASASASPAPSAPRPRAAAHSGTWRASASSNVYRVKYGDTLTSIAYSLGVSLDALIAANPQLDPNLIYVGDKVYY